MVDPVLLRGACKCGNAHQVLLDTTGRLLCVQDLFCAPRPMQCGAKDSHLKQLQQLVAGANDIAWNAEYGVLAIVGLTS